MEQIIVVPNVLSKEMCRQLIFDANFTSTQSEQPAFDYEDYNNLERRRMTDHAIVKSLANQFSWNVENAPLIWYPRNTSNSLHCDNAVIKDGEVIKMTDWTHSVIIFLNENFNGGELVYPQQGVTIKPKTGTMVVAPAGIEFPHYVHATDSDRYVLVLRLI